MCGIVGYIGEREAFPILMDSLKLVTYRGYDSFGVAVLNGEGIKTEKSLGAVDQCTSDVPEIHGTVGIGHTRWATVGGVNGPNAHPHEDCTGELAIVHNGDIENYQALRAILEAQGHEFKSQTDSEVIAHLIESVLESNIVTAVKEATEQLVGSYALVVLHRPSNSLVVARHHNPLVVGIGENEAFVASDVPALLPFTHQVIYLDDGDIGAVGKGGVTVWHSGREVERPVRSIDWDADQLDKAGYEHFMLKEIHEQPDAIRHTISRYSGEKSGAQTVADLIPLANPSEILLLGCGTSFHAALLGERLLAERLPIPVRAVVASEYQAHRPLNGDGLVIAMTQSGETADTVTAVSRAQAAGYKVLAVTNVMESSIARVADATFYTSAGPEIAVAATKTFIAQLIALHMIAEQMGSEGDQPIDLARFRRLPGIVELLAEQEETFKKAGELIADYDRLFIIAKGSNVPVAMEGALKFKEVAYLHTEGCPAGELKHGPFALLGEDTPVIAIVPSDDDRARVLNAMREIAARGSKLIAIADMEDFEVAEMCDSVLLMPNAGADLQPVINTIALQVVSYYTALRRGCPIDRPRNLAKSVTVL